MAVIQNYRFFFCRFFFRFTGRFAAAASAAPAAVKTAAPVAPAASASETGVFVFPDVGFGFVFRGVLCGRFFRVGFVAGIVFVILGNFFFLCRFFAGGFDCFYPFDFEIRDVADAVVGTDYNLHFIALFYVDQFGALLV